MQPEEMIEKSRSKRAIYSFKLPPSIQKHMKKKGITHLGLYELTPQEELDAANRSGNLQVKMAWELVKSSFRFTGKEKRTPTAAAPLAPDEIAWTAISLGDGSTDIDWDAMGPKARQLLTQAYSVIHAPKEEESSAFLASMEVVLQ